MSHLEKVKVIKYIKVATLLFLGQITIFLLQKRESFILTGGDTGRFVGAAKTFPYFSEGDRALGYASYVFLFRVFEGTHKSFLAIIILQIIIVFLAALSLFSLIEKIGNQQAAWVGVIIYLINPLTNRWTLYLLTESIFFAFLIFIMWSGQKYVKDRNKKNLLLFIFLTFFATFLRPNGFFLLAATMSFIIFYSKLKSIFKLIFILLSWIFVLIFLTLSSSYGDNPTNDFAQRMFQGEIIWDQPTPNIKMPQPSAEQISNSDYFDYALKNPISVTSLGVSRVFWEILQIRPWYSTVFNTYILIFMITFLFTAFIGRKYLRGESLNTLIYFIAIPHLALIAATWADFDGRFGWWVLTLLLPWSGIGTSEIFTYFKSKKVPY